MCVLNTLDIYVSLAHCVVTSRWGTKLNHVEDLLVKLKPSNDILTVGFIIILLVTLVGFFASVDIFLVLFILLCTLVSMRLLYGDEPTIRISTMRSNGKSVVFSDEKRKRFAAFSTIEIRDAPLFYPQTDNSDPNRSRVLKASRIIAEHIEAYSIEIDNRTSTVRFLVSSEANTATDACQKTEGVAERMLRVIRELYDNGVKPEMIGGERLRDAFLAIIGGDFESFNGVGNLVIRNKGENGDKYGFAMLTAMDPSFLKIDLRKLLSMIRNPDAVITYVINIQAHRTFNENVLIDGAEYGRTWLVSPYFIVSGTELRSIREVSTKLRNDVEDTTRAHVLRIQRGSSIISQLGRILLRSPLDKKLFLSNEQLITHVFGTTNR